MNIFIYDHVGKRVTSVPLPSDLDCYGYTQREIRIVKPLVAALIDVRDIENPETAAERLRALIWGLGPRLVHEGHIRDIRISVDGADKVLTPADPQRYTLFAKFLYDYKGKGCEGRFIVSTRPFDEPNYLAVRKL